jgi:hypothetical protein
LDRRIAVSVARGEAAIARQEAATAELRAISARMGGRLERAEEDRGDIKALVQETRASNRALIQETRVSNREMIAEMRADRERQEKKLETQDKKLGTQDKKLDVILAELREGRDERRAMIERLMRMIDRLPPPRPAS